MSQPQTRKVICLGCKEELARDKSHQLPSGEYPLCSPCFEQEMNATPWPGFALALFCLCLPFLVWGLVGTVLWVKHGFK